ncbi:MAG TPA: vWA domain-containing protein [Gemmataceae bacterium]|nr:vWA domain-containing protein [Gemmataceae bacterium]
MRKRNWLGIALLVGLAALFTLVRPTSAKPRSTAKKARPRVEVVFCLDTTGSMSGLIDGAKQKIWSLCNQIAGGKPTPEVKVGLVAYRDRGDEYVTKVVDLSDDLDAVHAKLMDFVAAGGGDEPESVNEALHDALHKINWSEDSGALRIIYLVGDAPPHMDYPQDIPYTVSCRQACEKGIIINTIQCGSIQSTTPIWQAIAHKAEGRFVQIAQDGGVQTVTTPFDGRLAEINAALAKTAVAYGPAPVRAEQEYHFWVGLEAARGPAVDMATPMSASAGAGGAVGTPMPCAAAPCVASACADRAGYCAKTGKVAALDLVDSIKEGKVRLEDVKTTDLPEEMQKLNLSERKAYLAKVEAERAKLQAEALELDRKRTDFISQELRRRGGNGFDDQVMDMLREQAKKVNLAY